MRQAELSFYECPLVIFDAEDAEAQRTSL